MVFGPNFFFHPSFVRVRASFVLSTIVDMCNRSFYTMYNYIHTNTYTHNPVTVTAGGRRPETGESDSPRFCPAVSNKLFKVNLLFEEETTIGEGRAADEA